MERAEGAASSLDEGVTGAWTAVSVLECKPDALAGHVGSVEAEMFDDVAEVGHHDVGIVGIEAEGRDGAGVAY